MVGEPELPEADRCADDVDRAADLELAFTADAVYQARKLARQVQSPDDQGRYLTYECVACGEEIGLGRLQAAARNDLCIYCATRQEKARWR